MNTNLIVKIMKPQNLCIVLLMCFLRMTIRTTVKNVCFYFCKNSTYIQFTAKSVLTQFDKGQRVIHFFSQANMCCKWLLFLRFCMSTLFIMSCQEGRHATYSCTNQPVNAVNTCKNGFLCSTRWVTASIKVTQIHSERHF